MTSNVNCLGDSQSHATNTQQSCQNTKYYKLSYMLMNIKALSLLFQNQSSATGGFFVKEFYIFLHLYEYKFHYNHKYCEQMITNNI